MTHFHCHRRWIGRLDILWHLEDNRGKERLEELNELKHFNGNIMREENNEELGSKKEKEKEKKRNAIKHSQERDTYDTNGNTDEFSGEAAGADTDTYDTSAGDGEFSFNGGKTQGSRNDRTYCVCATDSVSVPNVYAEYNN